MRRYGENRINALEAERLSWWRHWGELATYIMPRRYKWLITPNEAARGAMINTAIVDETATLALRVMRSGMMAGMTSPGRPWFRYDLRDMNVEDDGPVKLWLDEVQKRVQRILGSSNYYTSKAVQYEDLGLIGTAPMIIDEDADDVIRCHNPAAGEYFIWNDAKGRPGGLARRFVRTVQQLVDEFGLDAVSPTVRDLYKQQGNGLAREVVVCQLIEPNDAKLGTGLVPSMFPWRCIYWEQGANASGLLRAKGYHEQPFSCPRWDLIANDPYGRSPAMEALGACKQLQVEQRRKGEVIDKGARPPMKAHVSMKNEPASQLPGGITYVANMQDGGMEPVYVPDARYVELIREDIGEVQDRIRKVFYNDLFMMISQLENVRTATEIDARRAEQMVQLGPVLERQQEEGTDVELERIFGIMVRRSLPMWQMGMDGLLPLPPPQMHGKAPEVQYISMLADAQKAAATTAIERVAAFTGNIGAAVPDVFDNIDWDEAVEEYADLLNLSGKLIRDPKVVEQLRQNRQQQKQAEAALQTSMAAAQGAKTLSEADVGGGQNALQMMMGARA